MRARSPLLAATLLACTGEGPPVSLDTDPADPTDGPGETGAPDDTAPPLAWDAPVAGGRPAQDPELLPGDPPLVAWQSPVDHVVWIAEIDPRTGQWIPHDGRGVRVGKAAAMGGTRTRPATWNGPEWGADAEGDIVFFTAVDDHGIQQVAARRRGASAPVLLSDGDEHRSGALPQYAPGADRVAVAYFLGELQDRRVAWRWAGDADEHLLPPSPAYDPTPRFVPGQPALLTLAAAAPGAPTQVVRVDLERGVQETLTDDAGHKFDPFLVEDPATGERVLLAGVSDTLPGDLQRLVPSRVAVYDHDGAGWRRRHTLGVEDHLGGGPYAHTSIEPFEAGGHLWVSLVATEGDRRGAPTQVYVARADGSAVVQVTHAEGVLRSDPEVLVTPHGVLLYYTTPGRDGLPRVRVVRDVLGE